MAKAAGELARGKGVGGGAGAELPGDLLHRRDLLFNRELSWLEFNRRVLEEALDPSQPLLERLKFLSIFSTNLDEFFMIRVSGLAEQLEEEPHELSPDGRTPAEQLEEIAARLAPLVGEQARVLREEVLPALAREGVRVARYAELSEEERRALDEYFLENVFPVLTPQAVDASHPFPYISNLSLNLGLTVEPEGDGGAGDKFSTLFTDEPRFVRLKVPPVVPRLVPVGESGAKFTFLGDLINANLRHLFPGGRVGRGHLFRVTRDADVEMREDEADDLLRAMEQTLRRRRFGAAVRLEVTGSMPGEMRRLLAGSLELSEQDIYTINGPLNIPDLMELYRLDRPALKDRPLHPQVPEPLRAGGSVFDAVRRQDVLLHHPFTAYSTVTDFIAEAARDPDVLAIKICLYRTGSHSPIVQSLMDAAGRGKQVTALVELKARFDEENNIGWARRLEREGVHVVYGMRGLKTHCKVALVVRREGGRLARYVHVATGNYNPTTSRVYTDVGLLTADPEIGADVTDLFNFLTGCSRQTAYRRLLVAPVNLREGMTALIRREAEHARRGRPARIVAKVNSLTDTDVIRSLYEASQAGVEIDLVVRGVCMLRPGVEGFSERVRVRSVVGRFLEHSRIFYFESGGDEEVYIGSADWMRRNLDRRVEVVAPVKDPALRRRLKGVLDVYLRDDVKARELLPDGTYRRAERRAGEDPFDAQEHFARVG